MNDVILLPLSDIQVIFIGDTTHIIRHYQAQVYCRKATQKAPDTRLSCLISGTFIVHAAIYL